MIAGLGFYIVSLFLLVFYRVSRSQLSSIFITFFFILLWLYAGLRGDVGQDTLSYTNLYQEQFGVPIESWFLKMEPGFVALVWLHKYLFDNVTFFFLLYSAFQAVLLNVATKSMSHRAIFLAFYVVLFYFEFHLNVLRAGTAFLIVLIALRQQDKRKSAFIFVFSVLFHVSTIVFLPLLFLDKDFRLRYSALSFLLTIFVFGVVFYFLGDKFYLYLESIDFSYKFSSVFVVLFLVFVFSVFLKRRLGKVYLASSFYVLFFVFLVPYVDIAYRLLHPSLMLLMYFVFRGPAIMISGNHFRPQMVFVLVAMLWFSFLALSFNFDERQMRVETGAGDPDYSYFPYSTFLTASGR